MQNLNSPDEHRQRRFWADNIRRDRRATLLDMRIGFEIVDRTQSTGKYTDTIQDLAARTSSTHKAVIGSLQRLDRLGYITFHAGHRGGVFTVEMIFSKP